MAAKTKWRNIPGIIAAGVLVLAGFELFHPRRVSLEMAQRAQCKANLHQIYLALQAYVQEYGEPPASLPLLVAAGSLDRESIKCPSCLPERGESTYVYDGAAWYSESRPVAFDQVGNHAAPWMRQRPGAVRYGLYADGTIRDFLENGPQ